MRVNTNKSMQLGRRVKGQFGTWHAVRKAARVENGVYVLKGDQKETVPEPARPPAPARA